MSIQFLDYTQPAWSSKIRLQQTKSASTFRFRPRPGKRPDSRRHVLTFRTCRGWGDPQHRNYCLQYHPSWLAPCQQCKYENIAQHLFPHSPSLLTPDADQQYLEFKKDILTLQEQLETLKRNIEVVHKDEHARLAPTDQFHNIFADFRRTLEECQHFLERNSRFATQAGPMSNLQWALWAKDEAEMHRDRIAVLNLKLNLALQSLQM